MIKSLTVFALLLSLNVSSSENEVRQTQSKAEAASQNSASEGNNSADRAYCGQGWTLRIADASLLTPPARHQFRCNLKGKERVYVELNTGELDPDGMPVKVVAFLEHKNHFVESFDGKEIDSDLKVPFEISSNRLRIECLDCKGLATVRH